MSSSAPSQTQVSVQALQQKIEAKQDIVGETILDFVCLGCDLTLSDAKVQATNLHPKASLWNYYVPCPHCGYESNLSKYIPRYTYRG